MADDALSQLRKAGANPLNFGGRVALIDPNGQPVTVDEKDLEQALRNGYTLQSGAQVHEQHLQQEYGNAPVQSALEGGARSLTFGLSDALLAPLDEGIAERRKRNPGAALAGEIGGALLPVGAGALIGKAGAGAAQAVGETSLVEGLLGGGAASRAVGSALKSGVRAGTEGALFGVQQGISDVALSDEPHNAEAIVSTLGSHALYGGLLAGGAGAALGGLGSLVHSAGVRARNAADRWAQAENASNLPGDVGRMDLASAKAARADELTQLKLQRINERDDLRKQLTAERDTLKADRLAERRTLQQQRADEIDAIEKQRAGDLDAAGMDALTFREQLRDAAAGVEADVAKAGIEGIGLVRELSEAERAFNRIVDQIPSRPQQSLATLQRVERTVRQMRSRLAQAQEQAASDAAKTPMPWQEFRSARASQYAKELGLGASAKKIAEEYKAYKEAFAAGMPVPTKGYFDLGDRIQNLDTVLDQAGVLHQRIAQLTAPRSTPALLDIEARLGADLGPPTSQRMADIETRLAEVERAQPASERLAALDERLTALRNPSIGSQVANAAGGAALSAAGGVVGAGIGSLIGLPWIGGAVGAAAGVGFGALKKRLAASASEFAASLSKGIDRALAAGSAAMPALARTVAVGASFLPNRPEAPQAAPGTHTPGIERVANDVLMASADPNTRERIHDSLAGVRVVDPKLADQMEELAMARIAYLAERAPKNPGMATLGGGPNDRYRASDAALARFARCVAATENPLRILDELAANALTPDSVEAVRRCQPLTLERIQREVMEKIVASGQPVPRARRLGLTILLGSPVTSTLTPEFIGAMQQGYAAAHAAEQQQQPQAPAPAPSRAPRARAVTDLEPTWAQTQGF